ncbi:serine hydrolase domain-containing protein [Larkinella punicea]|uniref:Class A beta-lactamase-related serine hydrolase n=1 Tax=Larkinella punicea TaxID=2315727 RepID=A0A368JIK2_9BACT|nr:serine hydrolase domain-containing protein [Larkinella punicea]RCR65941.1 class A beta-lactamase-related serine hydrolase [Larkinella punicea]
MRTLSLPASFLKAILCILVSTHGLAQSKEDSLSLKMDAIFKAYNRLNGPGCAVGIIRDGTVIFEKGYGMANLEYDIPIKSATVFDIASVSKQFAGLAVSTLVQEGKIKLDDDIRNYLPDVPKFNKTITVRHLVHHTSGLRDWPQTLNSAGWRWDEVFSFEDIMRMVRNQKDLDFDPGARYSYSNTGYNLLAAIVEKVSGQSFTNWTQEHIFKPLQMNSSRFQDDYTRLIKNLAYSYAFRDREFVKSPGALTAYGSSSLFTTVQDLSKWVRHFDQQLLLKNPIYTAMLTEGTLNTGEKVPYGYGLASGKDRGLKTVSHTGSWAGYRTIITNYPDEKLSIIILSNASDFNVTSHSSEVASVFLKDKFKSEGKSAINVKDAPTIQLDPSLAKKYAGVYQLGPGWAVTLTLEADRLMTQANGEARFPTEAKSDSVIWIEAYGASMTFVPDKNGAVNLLKYRTIQAKRITPWVPNPSELPVFAGTYYSPELASEYKIDVVDGKLKMHHMRIGDFDLGADPTGVDQFSGKIGSIQFVKKGQKKITGFRLSGGRVKNIWFEKR